MIAGFEPFTGGGGGGGGRFDGIDLDTDGKMVLGFVDEGFVVVLE